jgi:ribosomal protein S12 methylthiotransferase accessory factor YcaO
MERPSLNDDLPSLERSYSPKNTEKALQAIVQGFADARGVTLARAPLDVPGRYCVTATDLAGVLSTGFGKGIHARFGAFGECIEHFHLRETAMMRTACLPVPPSELFTEDTIVRIGASLVPDGQLVRALPHRVLGREEITYVPSLMCGFNDVEDERPLEPHETFYCRYSSSSGTAFGLSHSDALLHALLEVIERDEISQLFLNVLGTYCDSQPYLLIEDYQFSKDVSAIWRELTAYISGPRIVTLVRRSSLGPFFSFSFYRDASHMRSVTWGAG